jgi:ribosomal protein S18 acetylase RimI-like enzyme
MVEYKPATSPKSINENTLEALNEHWVLLAKLDFPRRRRFEEVEGMEGDDYKTKRQKHLDACDNLPPLKGAKRGRRRAPDVPQYAYFYAPDPRDAVSCLRQSLAEELLEQDPLALEAFGSLVLQTPLQFEMIRSGAELEPGKLEACFKLVEKTSSQDYKAAKAGWRPKEKKNEMADDKMMYLLVKTKANEPAILGFISFMFTKDDPPNQGRQVVYIYEVHLDDGLRGCGLGSKLITFVELLALRCGIFKTMLTVFRTNAGAKGLYERLGYSKDESSPADKVVRRRVIEADYLIMSRVLTDEY